MQQCFHCHCQTLQLQWSNAQQNIIIVVPSPLSFQPPTSAVDRQDGPDVAGLLPQVEQPPQQPPRRLRSPAPGKIGHSLMEPLMELMGLPYVTSTHSLQTEAFCDVTIACDGASVKCHKMILSACSAYFQQLFMENTCDHPIVFLKVGAVQCGTVHVAIWSYRHQNWDWPKSADGPKPKQTHQNT